MKRSVLENFMDSCFELQNELSTISKTKDSASYQDYTERVDKARSAAAHRAANVGFLLTRITKKGHNSKPAIWFQKSWKILIAQMDINSVFETSTENQANQNTGYRDALSEMVHACQYWSFTRTKNWQDQEPPNEGRIDLSQVVELPGPTTQKDLSED